MCWSYSITSDLLLRGYPSMIATPDVFFDLNSPSNYRIFTIHNSNFKKKKAINPFSYPCQSLHHPYTLCIHTQAPVYPSCGVTLTTDDASQCGVEPELCSSLRWLMFPHNKACTCCSHSKHNNAVAASQRLDLHNVNKTCLLSSRGRLIHSTACTETKDHVVWNLWLGFLCLLQIQSLVIYQQS